MIKKIKTPEQWDHIINESFDISLFGKLAEQLGEKVGVSLSKDEAIEVLERLDTKISQYDTKGKMIHQQEHLTTYNRKYSNIWKPAEFVRERFYLSFYKSNYDMHFTYLPLEAWLFLVTYRNYPKAFEIKNSLNLQDFYNLIERAVKMATIEDQREACILSALAGWRYTQDIYVFDEVLYKTLIATDLESDIPNIPADIFLRLPCWTIYIEETEKYDDTAIFGFYVHLNSVNNNGEFSIIIVLDVRYAESRLLDSAFLIPIKLNMKLNKTYTLNDIVAFSSMKQKPLDWLAYKQSLGRFLSVIQYLCSDEPDITSHQPQPRPTYPKYVKTKKGNKLFPPNKPRIWNAGKVVGERIRQIQEEDRKAIEHKRPRPHIRRAHWHGFWSGKRDGEQKFNYKWLPPIIVGVDE
jgi:hypothetical protein